MVKTKINKWNILNDNEKLNSYLAAWQLSEPKLLKQTMTSQVYTVVYEAETVILKLLSSTETEEQRGAVALRYFNGQGAVRLLKYDEGAQLMEYAAGDELVTLVEDGEDENATRIIAQLIKILHSAPQDVSYNGMLMLDHWFGALFQKAMVDKLGGIDSIYVRSAKLAELMLVDQREVRALHGDLQHYNIRNSQRGWLAFDPKGVVGERTYDCANTLCNPVMPELVHSETRLLNTTAILADTLSIEMERILAFTYIYACLNASWWSKLNNRENAKDIVRWHLKVAAIIEPHIKLI
jgi:streptomycin 6-kinase